MNDSVSQRINSVVGEQFDANYRPNKGSLIVIIYYIYRTIHAMEFHQILSAKAVTLHTIKFVALEKALKQHLPDVFVSYEALFEELKRSNESLISIDELISQHPDNPDNISSN